MIPDRRARTALRRRSNRRTLRKRVLLALAILAAFAVGIALGQALHDNPTPGGQQTLLHTTPPLTRTTTP